jgi:predicted nuclease of predicted toxin-antitoxin system
VSLRFFADHCVPSYVIQILCEAGYEVLKLQDHIPADSPDQVVISHTQEIGAILLSLNGDFADITVYTPAKYKGIVALQVRNHPEIIIQLVQRLKNYLSNHQEMEHYSGKLLIVETHRIRSRG